MIKSKKIEIDSRVYLFMLFAGVAASILAESETALFGLFAVALVFQVIGQNAGKLPSYILFWFVLLGISQLGLYLLRINPTWSIGITFANFGIAGHRAIVPLLFAMLLYQVPSGSFIGALNAMHMPKAFGIGIGIMLRFFPTVSQEYRSIRNAQQFRGIGIGFWNTIFHLPRVISSILLPLVIRITRISEELSASVTVRGVRFHNSVVSFRPIRFTLRDTMYLSAGIFAFALILILNKIVGVIA